MLIENRLVSLLSPEKYCHFSAMDTLVFFQMISTYLKKTKIENVPQHIHQK